MSHRMKFVYHCNASFSETQFNIIHHDGIVRSEHKICNNQAYDALKINIAKKMGVTIETPKCIIINSLTLLHMV